MNSYFSIIERENRYLSCWQKYHIAGEKCIFRTRKYIIEEAICIFWSASDISESIISYRWPRHRISISLLSDIDSMIRDAASLHFRLQSDPFIRMKGSLLRVKRQLTRVKRQLIRVKRQLIRVNGIGLRVKILPHDWFWCTKCPTLCPPMTSSRINTRHTIMQGATLSENSEARNGQKIYRFLLDIIS